MSLIKYVFATLLIAFFSFNSLPVQATYTTNGDGWVETIETTDVGTCFRCNEHCDSDDDVPDDDKEMFVAPDQTNPSDDPNRNW